MNDSADQQVQLSAKSFEGWSRPRLVFLAISAALLLLLLVWAREVLLPFILATIIAYVLTPAVARCERSGLPRAVAIIGVYGIVLGVAYAGVATFAPRIYREAATLSREAPTMASQLAAEWGPVIEERINTVLGRHESGAEAVAVEQPAASVEHRPDGTLAIELGSGFDVVQDGPKRWRVTSHKELPGTFSISKLFSESINEAFSYARRNALELIRVGHAVISKFARGALLGVMTLMLAGYLMHTRERVLAFFRSLVAPVSRQSFDQLLARIDLGLAGVVRGQLLICLVNGVLSAIGFALLGLKYWPILAIIAAVMSIVPIFGSILSTVPAVLVGLTQDVWTAFWVLLWILLIHQLEANFLNPKIIGTAAKLHPVLVVFALLLGEHTHGIWGALLAVPALSVAQSVFNHFKLLAMPDVPRDSLLPHR